MTLPAAAFRVRVRLKQAPGNLVLLHDGRPPLSDVPCRLRLLADQIEAGEYGEITASVVVLEGDADWPAVFGFGDMGDARSAIGLCELAKAFLVQNVVSRA